MVKLRKNKKAGFTLIELLIVILIIGILAAVGIPLYLGYVSDAKTAEAKGLVGSMWTAMRGCAQSKPGSGCTASSQFGRVGLNGSGVTADTRWTVRGTDSLVMGTDSVFVLTGKVQATGATGTDVDGIVVALSYANTGTPPGTFACTIGGVTGSC